MSFPNWVSNICLVNFLIPKTQVTRSPGKVPSCQISFFSLTHILSPLSEIQVARDYPEAQRPVVHLSVSSTPNTCVKRSLSRMRP